MTLGSIYSLISSITQPIAGIKTELRELGSKSQEAFGKIAAGGQTISDSFWSTHSFLESAIQMDDALQSASLQGIDSGVMAKIAKDSVTFSSQYGKSAIEFVNSAAEINKAVQGLEQTELPQMTKIANTTAVALKTSATDAATYMGKMFDLFSEDAESVGNLQFAEELSGKAVFMAQTFGTSMPEMTQLLEGARKAGTNFGVGIDEQLAVLGQLQSSLGDESSRAYESFLSVAVSGGKSLGLSFVNASGQMLSMPEMLEKLQAKYGTSIEGNLKAQAEIEAAFGDSAVVVKALFSDVDTLNKNIAELGANDGMDRTRAMAAQMADPWERLQQIWQNLHILIGSALLPVIKPLVNWLADTSQVLVRWMKLFPNIARWVGYITLAIMNFTVAGAVANIVMGISKFILIGLRGIFVAFTLITKLGTAAIWLYNSAITAWSRGLAILRGTLLAIRMAAVLAGISFSFMSWPVLLIIAAIALLAYGIYKLIQNWDEIKASIMDTEAFKKVASAAQWIGNIFEESFACIAEKWNELANLFSDFSLSDMFSGLGDILSFIPGFGAASIGAKVIGKVIADPVENTISSNMGIDENTQKLIAQPNNILQGQSQAMLQPMPTQSVQAINPQENNGILTGGKMQGINRNGLINEVASNSQTVNDNSRRIESVTLNISNSMTPDQLMEWEHVAYG
ncbi:phage tail tape measure protein [Xenorhabdus mauleonii]|uniref:Phage tail tape measure protein n=1 Tax=Xenorhabdus mauleonii TaxID=351675 RepID=A0A1I3RB79_9GAMM|nr:phage tail tape measure protein [Xenorhabdus mauleonii]PHM39805.1 phage tail tape measure protein [Xenorhabdus mauleonii]SFJ43052.1 phage tail tape measure protein, TP901 family, core region [Xenorhabdus mauleonii]